MSLNAGDYIRLQALSEQGTYPATGFKSGLYFLQHFSLLDFNINTTVATTFKIFTSPTESETDRLLFFQKDITANTTFHRRFDIPPQYIQIELNNTTSTAGSFILSTHVSLITQFNASTFLNSKIKVDANTSLQRVANDFNVDMVRGLHDDFKKVNIQGITNQQNSTQYTIGVNNFDVLNIGTTPINVYVQNTSVNDTTGGTGARTITIDYIDQNYDEQTVGFAMPAGVGVHIVSGVQALAVHRVTVGSTGTLLQNSGSIFVTNSTGVTIFAEIPPGDNVSHGCYFLVPRNNELMLTDINLSAIGFPATIRVYELNLDTMIRGSIGDFRLSTNYAQLVYRLNGKIDARRMVMVNLIPDAGAPTTQTLVNININAVLCPLINSF